MNRPELTVIIVSYNVRELLVKCITSLYKYIACSLEIIVVDNNSSDGTQKAVEEKFPSVIFIANKGNAGFPKANNQALEIANGEIIFLLNPDTELIDETIGELIRFIKNNQLCIAAPRLLNTDHSLQESIQPFIKVSDIVLEAFFLQTFFKRRKKYLFAQDLSVVSEIEAASGAALMMKREVFEKIGFLDEELFWTEDMEFCYRANKNNIKCYYVPEVKILHHIGQSGTKNPSVMISNQVLTKINYFRKNHSYINFLTVWFARFLHIISRIFIFAALTLFLKKYISKFKAYCFTLNRFVRNNY